MTEHAIGSISEKIKPIIEPIESKFYVENNLPKEFPVYPHTNVCVNSVDPILEEREKTHGQFDKVAQTANTIKDCIIAAGSNLNPPQAEALDMIVSKIARIVNGDPNFPDHWLDIAGYATLAAKYSQPLKLGKPEEHEETGSPF